MKMRNKYGMIVLCTALFLCAQAFPQQETDSLLKEANKQIYENPDLAITLAKQAFNSEGITVKNQIGALMAISTAYSSKRDYEKSAQYVEQIKELLPKIKNDRQRMNILNRIAGYYQEIQIYDKALDYLDESLRLIQKYPLHDSIQPLLGYNAALRGFIYREQMNCDIALKYFDKAIEAYKQTQENHVRNANLSICYYNKGNCLLSIGKNEEAKLNYNKAIEYAKNVEAKSLIAFGQKGLAEAKTLEGNYKEAITLLKNAKSISEEVGDLLLDQSIFEGLSNNYLALHDWDNYTLFHSKFLALQKETKKSERKTINQSLLSLTNSKSTEIEQLKKRNSPIQIGLLCFIGISLFLLGRFVFFKEKKLRELQKKLEN